MCMTDARGSCIATNLRSWPMRIEDFTRQEHVHSEAELVAILAVRDHRNSNCFWLSFDDEVFPRISISVRNDFAYAHYFPEKGHPGFHTVSNNPHAGLDAMHEFFLYGKDETTIEVMGPALISVPDAILVAKEFLRNRSLPTCVEWFEL